MKVSRLCLAFVLLAAWGASAATASGQGPHGPSPQGAGRMRSGPGGHGRGRSAVTIPASSPKRRHIRTQTVATADLGRDQVAAPGRLTLDPRRTSRVAVPVPGRVQRVLVKVGDAVRAGAPLLTVESPEAEAAAAEWRRAEAAMSQAEASLRRARADLDRLQDLLAHKAVASKEVLHAELDLAQAEASRTQADAARTETKRRLEILGLEQGGTGREVVVRAPLAGKVLEVAVTPGEYRHDTAGPVVTIADLGSLLVVSDVPERDIRLVEVGERVAVELVSYPGETFEARVTRIGDLVDTRTRTVQVQAEVSNRQGRLRAEMYGWIRHSHAARAVPVVPVEALVQSADGLFVYVERPPGTFEPAPVVVGAASRGRVPVLRGVSPGDQVVVDGAMLLADTRGRDGR